MLSLIKIEKLRIIFRSKTYTVTMQERMLALKGPADRKRWGWSPSILPHVLLNRIGMLNGRSLLYSTEYIPCSMAVNLLLS